MKILMNEYREYLQRTNGDGSISPLVDTGFRMEPTEPSTYTPRPNPPTKRTLEYLNIDDYATVESYRNLRGVNYIVIDYDKADQRILDDIRRIITRRHVQEAEVTHGTTDEARREARTRTAD